MERSRALYSMIFRFVIDTRNAEIPQSMMAQALCTPVMSPIAMGLPQIGFCEMPP